MNDINGMNTRHATRNTNLIPHPSGLICALLIVDILCLAIGLAAGIAIGAAPTRTSTFMSTHPAPNLTSTLAARHFATWQAAHATAGHATMRALFDQPGPSSPETNPESTPYP